MFCLSHCRTVYNISVILDWIKTTPDCITWYSINSSAPGRPGCHLKTAIFNLVLLIDIFTLSDDNVFRWMPWHLTDDKSKLVQVMAWCRQATRHYLSQCWPRSLSLYGVPRPQCVNSAWRGFWGLFNKKYSICIFVGVNFDALATGKWCRIERILSCLPLLIAGFEPRVSENEFSADWKPADKPTDLLRIKLKTWTQ